MSHFLSCRTREPRCPERFLADFLPMDTINYINQNFLLEPHHFLVAALRMHVPSFASFFFFEDRVVPTHSNLSYIERFNTWPPLIYHRLD